MKESNNIIDVVKNAQKGDVKSFEYLVRKYSTPIYNLALRILNDEHEAQDVLQDTFLAAYEKLHTFNFQSHFYTWLYRIATNFALMRIRKNKNNVLSETDFEHQYEIPFQESLPSSTIWNPDKILLNEELKKRIEEGVRRLPPIYKTVFILRDIEGVSIKETSEILGISENNVKIRLKRARIYLKEYLEKIFSEKGLPYETQS
jgi:RNA polymerase sigma-70 factor (ECF subfamily)